MTKNINAVEGSREYLEAKHGQVWDTTELQQEFEVLELCFFNTVPGSTSVSNQSD
jgi:hypothetical protein